MTRIKRIGIVLAVLLLALATAAPVAAGNARPFRGSWVGADGFDFAAPGCPVGVFVRFNSSSTGMFQRLGPTSVEMTHCTWVDPTTNTGRFDLGTITLTAANGDTLVLGDRGTFQLTPNAGIPPYSRAVGEYEWWIVSGTGRFEHATGSGVGISDDDMLAGTQAFSIWGTITY